MLYDSCCSSFQIFYSIRLSKSFTCYLFLKRLLRCSRSYYFLHAASSTIPKKLGFQGDVLIFEELTASPLFIVFFILRINADINRWANEYCLRWFIAGYLQWQWFISVFSPARFCCKFFCPWIHLHYLSPWLELPLGQCSFFPWALALDFVDCVDETMFLSFGSKKRSVVRLQQHWPVVFVSFVTRQISLKPSSFLYVLPVGDHLSKVWRCPGNPHSVRALVFPFPLNSMILHCHFSNSFVPQADAENDHQTVGEVPAAIQIDISWQRTYPAYFSRGKVGTQMNRAQPNRWIPWIVCWWEY